MLPYIAGRRSQRIGAVEDCGLGFDNEIANSTDFYKLEAGREEPARFFSSLRLENSFAGGNPRTRPNSKRVPEFSAIGSPPDDSEARIAPPLQTPPVCTLQRR
jgi:hypothetical protein